MAAGFFYGFVRKLDHQVALGHAAFGQVHADPVVRQARPGQHQMARLELADPVAHKGFARGGGDQVQLVFVVVMPARQRRGKAMRQAADDAHLVRRLIAQCFGACVVLLQFGLGLAGTERSAGHRYTDGV